MSKVTESNNETGFNKLGFKLVFHEDFHFVREAEMFIELGYEDIIWGIEEVTNRIPKVRKIDDPRYAPEIDKLFLEGSNKVTKESTNLFEIVEEGFIAKSSGLKLVKYGLSLQKDIVELYKSLKYKNDDIMKLLLSNRKKILNEALMVNKYNQ